MYNVHSISRHSVIIYLKLIPPFHKYTDFLIGYMLFLMRSTHHFFDILTFVHESFSATIWCAKFVNQMTNEYQNFSLIKKIMRYSYSNQPVTAVTLLRKKNQFPTNFCFLFIEIEFLQFSLLPIYYIVSAKIWTKNCKDFC